MSVPRRPRSHPAVMPLPQHPSSELTPPPPSLDKTHRSYSLHLKDAINRNQSHGLASKALKSLPETLRERKGAGQRQPWAPASRCRAAWAVPWPPPCQPRLGTRTSWVVPLLFWGTSGAGGLVWMSPAGICLCPTPVLRGFLAVPAEHLVSPHPAVTAGPWEGLGGTLLGRTTTRSTQWGGGCGQWCGEV